MPEQMPIISLRRPSNNVQMGASIIVDTLSVTDILEMLAERVDIEEILKDFPDLEREDIHACLAFAARRTDFPRIAA